MLTLQEYYDQEEVLQEMIHSVENPSWHVWKVADIDGKFRQNKKKINSTKRLREFLGDQPSKVYVSIAQFLNPQRVFGKIPKKAQWIISDTHFLKSDLLFDIDDK